MSQIQEPVYTYYNRDRIFTLAFTIIWHEQNLIQSLSALQRIWKHTKSDRIRVFSVGTFNPVKTVHFLKDQGSF